MILDRFTKGAAVLTITTFLSYIMGMLRDRIFARTFGLGVELDLYNAAFTVPDLLLNILVMSAISGAFIPLFTGLLTQQQKEKAHALANSTLNAACLVILISGVIAFFAMPWLVPIIASGEKLEPYWPLLITLSRLMLISPLILALSNTLGAMLVGYKSFLPYGLSPILYNIGIIAGALSYPWFGIYGLTIGTLAGALLHLLPRLIAITRFHFSHTWHIAFRDRDFRALLKLMVPKMFGHPVEQLTFASFNSIATHIVVGGISSLSFARNFQSVPVSLFGISFSVAAFPLLSQYAAAADMEQFKKSFLKALRDILIFTVPSALGLYLLSDIPIRIFLGGGNFGDEHILRTAKILSILSLAIPTESLIHLLARSFYALKNTLIPVVLSILGMAIAIAFASLKVTDLGMLAIPYGFFLGSFTEMIVLGILLYYKLKKSIPNA